MRVTGRAIGPLGRQIPAKAVVTVDTIASTLPGRAKTHIGGRTALPVAWEPAPDGAFGTAGVVTLRGTARIVDGGTAGATVRVQVSEPVQTNIAPDAGVSVAATYTESGYSAERLRNGDTAEKAWSNWRSGTKNPSDTITFSLPAARDLNRVVAHFHRDGTDVSFPSAVKAQVRGTDGTWADASGEIAVGTEGTPVVGIPLEAAGPATGVRVAMTARPVPWSRRRHATPTRASRSTRSASTAGPGPSSP